MLRNLKAGVLVAPLLVAPLLMAAPAQAAGFPERAVTVVVPYAPGGSNDIAARILSTRLGEALKQTVVVDNRAGAGGNIGATHAARAKSDGYTILMMSSAHVANRSLYSNLQYDLLKDFEPVARVASNPYVMVVHADNSAATLPAFIEWVKSSKTPPTYGSAGSGTSQHLAGAMFADRLGKEMTHVPYSGGAPAVTDLLAGRIDVIFAPLSEVKSFIDGGRLKALAVTTPERVAGMPSVPAISEALPQFELTQWNGFVVPAGTPKDRVATLAKAVESVLSNPDAAKELLDRGIFAAYMGPDLFVGFMSSEASKWADIVKLSGAQVN